MERSENGETRTIVHRLEGRPGGPLREAGSQQVPGAFAPRRASLLWAPERGLGPNGRLFQFGGGTYGMDNTVSPPDKPWAEQIVSMQAPAGLVAGGWLHRRYYTQPGYPRDYFKSRSTPGVTWFGGDIAYANRLREPDPANDDTLVVAFYGSGALPETMGDFNDVEYISRVGLSHSIWYLVP